MNQLVKIFKALSDQNRVRIIKLLENGKLCVCEITYILQLATSTVSKHLSILREANLILDEKEGKWVNYYLNEHHPDISVQQIIDIIHSKTNDNNQIQNDLLKLKGTNRDLICEIIKIN